LAFKKKRGGDCHPIFKPYLSLLLGEREVLRVEVHGVAHLRVVERRETERIPGVEILELTSDMRPLT